MLTALALRRAIARVPSAALRRGVASGKEYTVPAAAIDSFRTKGYALLPQFLTEEELLPIERLYDAFMRGEIMTQKVRRCCSEAGCCAAAAGCCPAGRCWGRCCCTAARCYAAAAQL